MYPLLCSDVASPALLHVELSVTILVLFKKVFGVFTKDGALITKRTIGHTKTSCKMHMSSRQLCFSIVSSFSRVTRLNHV